MPKRKELSPERSEDSENNIESTPPLKKQKIERKPIGRTSTFEVENEELNVRRRSSLLKTTSSILNDQKILEDVSQDNQAALNKNLDSLLQPSSIINVNIFQDVLLEFDNNKNENNQAPVTEQAEIEEAKNEEEKIEEEDDQVRLENLPVELIMIIFEFLSDGNKWKLASTNSRFMAIFMNWVGFDTTPIYYQDGISTLTYSQSQTIIQTPTKSSKIVLVNISNWTMPNSVHDMQVLANRRNISEQFFRHTVGKHHAFVVFEETEDLLKLRNKFLLRGAEKPFSLLLEDFGINSCLTLVPMNPEGRNWMIPRIFENSPGWRRIFGLFNSENEPLSVNIKDYFIEPHFILYPDYTADFYVGLNTRRFRDGCDSPNDVSEYTKYAILQMVSYQSIKAIDAIRWSRSFVSAIPPSAQPKGLKCTLHEYQLRALAWMKNIEAHAYNKTYSFSTVMKASGSVPIYLNVQPILEEKKEKKTWKKKWLNPEKDPWCKLENWRPVEPSQLDNFDNKDTVLSFKATGGFMADEMGLGKTVSMIALLLANPRVKDAKAKKYLPLGKSTALFESKATLVICPTQLVSQWENEIKSKTDLKVITVGIVSSLKKLTYNDFIETDVVITSHNLLLNNKNYAAMVAVSTTTDVSPDTNQPLFHEIGWHRIIIDEGHEVLAEFNKSSGNAIPCHVDMWEKFSSNYRWYVTGTPVPLGRASLAGALRFLRVELNKYNDKILTQDYDPKFFALELLLYQAFRKCLFWRNTKSTVTDQTKIPPVVEKVHFLPFTSIEQALYNAAKVVKLEDEMRLLCAMPLLALRNEILFPFTAYSKPIPEKLEEIPMGCIDLLKSVINKCREMLPKFKTAVLNSKARLVDLQRDQEESFPQGAPPVVTYQQYLADHNLRDAYNLHSNYQQHQKKITAQRVTVKTATLQSQTEEKLLIDSISQLACFSRLLPSDETSMCELCGNAPFNPDITPCQHIFCTLCITEHIKTTTACPKCEQKLNHEELQTLDNWKEAQAKRALKKKKKTTDGSEEEGEGEEEEGEEEEKEEEENEKKPKATGKRQKAKVSDLPLVLNETAFIKHEAVNCYGSKIAAVGGYLQKIMKSTKKVKVIVFSQYEYLLSALTKLLERADKKNFNKQIVSCKGNIHMRKKILASFSSDDKDSPRILLLSLSHSASGTHLAVATHIVLVDPVVGTKEEALATDAQAIARAHRIGQNDSVVAVRFIVENAIEQQDYEQAYGTIGKNDKKLASAESFTLDMESENEEEPKKKKKASPKGKKKKAAPKKKSPAKASPKRSPGRPRKVKE